MTRTLTPLFVLALLALMMTVVFYAVVPMPAAVYPPRGAPFTDHAVMAHGLSMVEAADKCGDNPIKTLWNKDEGRYVDICKDERGYWAVYFYKVVDGIKRRVTSFERESARSMSDVVDYVKNTGYTRNPLAWR
jgi:hypothetical protein